MWSILWNSFLPLSVVCIFFCHLPFLAGIITFSTLRLDLTSARVTASYSYEGLVAVAIYSDKLAHIQVFINCGYFVAQMCTREDTLGARHV